MTFAFSFLSCSIDVTKDDPRWLGAWWIGFLVSWLFAWSLIIPFSCFPKHLPGKLVFFKFRIFYSNSRPHIISYMMNINEIDSPCFIESVILPTQTSNIDIHFRKFWIAISTFIMGFLCFCLIIQLFLSLHYYLVNLFIMFYLDSCFKFVCKMEYLLNY